MQVPGALESGTYQCLGRALGEATVVLTASSKSKLVSGCLVCPRPGTIAQEPCASGGTM